MSDAGEMLPSEERELWAEGFVCQEGHLHLFFSWRQARPPKKEVMADRLDTSKAQLPGPEPALFQRMANVGQECYEVMAEQGMDDTDIWYFVAREMYCTLAKIGGAKAKPIRERASS